MTFCMIISIFMDSIVIEFIVIESMTMESIVMEMIIQIVILISTWLAGELRLHGDDISPYD